MSKIRFENIGEGRCELFVDNEYRGFARDRVEMFWYACNVDPESVPEWADEWLETALPEIVGPTDTQIDEEIRREFG